MYRSENKNFEKKMEVRTVPSSRVCLPITSSIATNSHKELTRRPIEFCVPSNHMTWKMVGWKIMKQLDMIRWGIVWVCPCVCVSQREKGWERGRQNEKESEKKEREREREREEVKGREYLSFQRSYLSKRTNYCISLPRCILKQFYVSAAHSIESYPPNSFLLFFVDSSTEVQRNWNTSEVNNRRKKDIKY